MTGTFKLAFHKRITRFRNYWKEGWRRTAERNHQGLGQRLIIPGPEVGRTTGEIVCRERLGGLLRYYYREAA